MLTEKGSQVVSCKRGKELSGSTKGWKFLGQLLNKTAFFLSLRKWLPVNHNKRRSVQNRHIPRLSVNPAFHLSRLTTPICRRGWNNEGQCRGADLSRRLADTTSDIPPRCGLSAYKSHSSLRCYKVRIIHRTRTGVQSGQKFWHYSDARSLLVFHKIPLAISILSHINPIRTLFP